MVDVFVWWFWIVCVSLGEIRFVHSLSETVSLMQSDCARWLMTVDPSLNCVVFSCVPASAFRSNTAIERRGLVSHSLFPPTISPNPTTHTQKPSTAVAMRFGFDVICNHAEHKHRFSDTHEPGHCRCIHVNQTYVQAQNRPDPGMQNSLRLFSWPHHRSPRSGAISAPPERLPPMAAARSTPTLRTH